MNCNRIKFRQREWLDDGQCRVHTRPPVSLHARFHCQFTFFLHTAASLHPSVYNIVTSSRRLLNLISASWSFVGWSHLQKSSRESQAPYMVGAISGDYFRPKIHQPSPTISTILRSPFERFNEPRFSNWRNFSLSERGKAFSLRTSRAHYFDATANNYETSNTEHSTAVLHLVIFLSSMPQRAIRNGFLGFVKPPIKQSYNFTMVFV